MAAPDQEDMGRLLERVRDSLARWAREGPPPNPRASAGELAHLLEAVAARGSAAEEVVEKGPRADFGAHVVELEGLRAQVARLEARLAEAQAELGAAKAKAEARLAEVQAELGAAKAELGAAKARAEEEEKEGGVQQLEALEARLRAAGEEHAAEVDRLRQQHEQLRTEKEASERQAQEQLKAQERLMRENLPSVSVLCRIRPLESYSGRDPSQMKIAPVASGSELTLEDGSSRPRKFRADRILDQTSSQEDVFGVVAPWVEGVLAGESACVFAYGATGSGKTYTLQGGGDADGQRGLAHHALKRLLLGPGGGRVQISMVEVYCDQVRDLLQPPEAGVASPPVLLCSRRDSQGRMVLDCARAEVESFAAAEAVLQRGYGARAAGKTLCNDSSSRSHVLLMVEVLPAPGADACAAPGGRLVLADLAGSENVHRSGANDDARLLAEAKAINRSLSALADVVEATAKRQQFVPYRNSRLTMLLEESFAASKVLVVVHVSPLLSDSTDTGHSLQFAGRVRAVDFGAQRLRAEQEDRLRAAHQRSADENSRLRQQLEQLRKEKEASERQAQERLKAQERVVAEQQTQLAEQVSAARQARRQAGAPSESQCTPTRRRQPTPMPSRAAREETRVAMAAGDSPPAESPTCAAPAARSPLGDITNLREAAGAGDAIFKEKAPRLRAKSPSPKEKLPAQPPAASPPAALPPAPRRLGLEAAPREETAAAEAAVAEAAAAADAAPAADATPAAPAAPLKLRSALKANPTNFHQRSRQRLDALLNGGPAPEEELQVKRHVHFEDEFLEMRRSPPRWYLDYQELLNRELEQPPRELAKVFQQQLETSLLQPTPRRQLLRQPQASAPRAKRELSRDRVVREPHHEGEPPRWRS